MMKKLHYLGKLFKVTPEKPSKIEIGIEEKEDFFD